MSTGLRQLSSTILFILSQEMGFRPFFNNIKKYEHWMKTVPFEDIIIINFRSYDAELR
jgi:hypothetical protein